MKKKGCYGLSIELKEFYRMHYPDKSVEWLASELNLYKNTVYRHLNKIGLTQAKRKANELKQKEIYKNDNINIQRNEQSYCSCGNNKFSHKQYCRHCEMIMYMEKNPIDTNEARRLAARSALVIHYIRESY
jgi:hypothetical protein